MSLERGMEIRGQEITTEIMQENFPEVKNLRIQIKEAFKCTVEQKKRRRRKETVKLTTSYNFMTFLNNKTYLSF